MFTVGVFPTSLTVFPFFFSCLCAYTHSGACASQSKQTAVGGGGGSSLGAILVPYETESLTGLDLAG